VKKIALILIVIACTYMPALAITGLGVGIHAGQTTGYNCKTLDQAVQTISDSLKILIPSYIPDGTSKFDEKMTSIGAHFKVGTLPILDFIGFIDYAWKKKELINNVDLRVSNFSYGVTVVKKFGKTIMKPYAGAGFAFYKVVYNLESPDGLLLPPLPGDETKMGYHLVGGVELDLPVFPVAPYAEGRYNIITTTDKSTKYLLLSLGLTMNF
jgi:hypothetical protein